MTITLRQESDSRATTKGSALTFAELDNNFKDVLNRATLVVEDSSNTQATLGNDGAKTAELKFAGAGGLTTAVTTDSTGQVILTLTQAAATGGISEVTAGTNIAVSNPDSAGAVEVALAGQVNNAVFNAPSFKGYKETIKNISTDSAGSINIDVANDGNIAEITLRDNVTFTGFTNAVDGQSVTLILKQDGTGNRTFTEGLDSAGSMVFAGGTSTLSTGANAVDVMSIVYAGGVYYASLSTNFS